MNFSDIRVIENKFKIKLPSDYSNFLLNYPEVDNDDKPALEESIFNSLDLLINTNEWFIEDMESLIRSNGNSSFTWDPKNLVIGTDGCGNHFYINTKNDASKVFFLEASDGQSELVAKSIDSFYKLIKKQLGTLV